MRRVALALVAALAVAAAFAGRGGAADECRGIAACIPVPGPWVVVRHGVEGDFLASCGRYGVVGGLDADATTAAVRVSFDGRIGSPVSPGVTTTQKAFFRGRLVGRRRLAAFKPWLGCIPASAGGGRSTVSARVAPGAALDRRARILVVQPGEVRTAAIGCPGGEQLVGGWDSLAFRTTAPPDLRDVALVAANRVISGGKVYVTVNATDALSIDAHAVVQVGAECAP
jgi:hypothetical protein